MTPRDALLAAYIGAAAVVVLIIVARELDKYITRKVDSVSWDIRRQWFEQRNAAAPPAVAQ